MLNIAVVDDEQEAVNELKSHVKRYCDGRGIEYSLTGFTSPVKFLAGFKPEYDLVFMDIEMPDMNGMDAARNLRKMDGEVALIFVTNMAQYAIRGYDVDADDFVVKPVKYGNLEIKLDRILKKHIKKDRPHVTVYENGEVKYLSIAEIRYVEVIKHNIIYHVADGTYEKRGVLKSEAALFSANGFAQCNKSCLVNLSYVLGISGYVLHVAKSRGAKEYDELSVSHPRKKEFVHTLNKYLEEHL
ncbi:MAG: response regulator transcription factor [Clostridiales bacterium]|nr:response regulator transcription factor [Clostridiales bacterium]